MDTTTLFLGMLFGVFGFGFFRYGKKQGAVVPLISGVVLMVFPYFVANVTLMIVIGVMLIAVPFFVRI